MLKKVLSYIAKLIGAEIGQLNESGGFVVQIAPSQAGTTYLDGSSSDNLSLLFLCKNKNQQICLETLESACNKLTRTKRHLHGIHNLYVATAPNYVGKEGDYWIYSCIVNLKYYNEEVF